MNRRTLATVIVAALLLALGVVAALLPVPYVVMSPGPTVDVLAERNNRPIIEVSGKESYPTKGDLRLTTVSVTNPSGRIGLVEAMQAWFDGTRAVYPRDVIYPPDQSAEDVELQSDVEMVGSQDTAVAVALKELGYDPPLQVEVLGVTKDSPAEGKLEVRDRILAVDGTKITGVEQVTKRIQEAGVGKPVELLVSRDGKKQTVRITTEASSDNADRAVVGVRIGDGYDFPFDVDVRLSDDIGGPSAGLIFSLGVYDTLTPGSLSGGADIAGTGTIDAQGRVGPIGGIQQKVVAAADAGAEIFLVPPDNCEAASQADVTKDEIKLVKAPTMHDAVEAIETYADDESAKLPAC